VNVPGFPVMRSSAAFDDDGNVVALAASAFGSNIEVNGAEGSPCADSEVSTEDPVGEVALAVIERIEARSRMTVLAKQEAARRFAALKQRGI
jgi:hypothetical protein